MNRFRALIESGLQPIETPLFEAKKTKFKITIPVDFHIDKAGGDMDLAAVYAKRDATGAQEMAEEELMSRLRIGALPFNVKVSVKFKRINKNNEAEWAVTVNSADERFQKMIGKIKL